MRELGYKIAICDDDDAYIAYLKGLIEDIFNGDLRYYIYHSGEELLKEVDVLHDAVILDIQMNGIDGTMTAKKLREKNKMAVLAFCSGVMNPTPESIKMSPYRYLMKQYSDERIRSELSEVLDKMAKSYKEEYIMAENMRGRARIFINDIVYIAKIKYGSCIYLVDPSKYGNVGDLIVKKHLKELYVGLSSYGFEFAHDSYLVNCRWVKSFERTFLTLENGEELNIARSKYMRFQKSLIRYWDKYERRH